MFHLWFEDENCEERSGCYDAETATKKTPREKVKKVKRKKTTSSYRRPAETSTAASLPQPRPHRQRQRTGAGGAKRRRPPFNRVNIFESIISLSWQLLFRKMLSARWPSGRSGLPAARPATRDTRSGPGSTSCPLYPTGGSKQWHLPVTFALPMNPP